MIETWDLGEGESSVLAWALAHPGSVAILDDLAARLCAAALGIAHRDCVGLTLLAKRRGLFPAVRPLVHRLRDAGLYLGDTVVKRVLALAGEGPWSRDVEVELRFLTTAEGGRKGPAYSGYRPQIFYDGRDFDANHEYPDVESVNRATRSARSSAF